MFSNGFRLDVVETLAYFYDSNIGREVRLNGNQTSVEVEVAPLLCKSKENQIMTLQPHSTRVKAPAIK